MFLRWNICPCIAVFFYVCCLIPAVCPFGGNAHATVIQADTTSGDSAQAPAATDFPSGPIAYQSTEDGLTTQVYAGFSLRKAKLDWNIAGQTDGTNPNILSELTWDNLDISELNLGFRSYMEQGIYLGGYLNYGRIVSGKNQDSDYYLDDRQGEFSRSNNRCDDGSTIDISLGTGYALPMPTDIITLIPLVGFSFHQQNLTITDGFQTVTWAQGPPLGPFPGLDSSYSAQWWGPWVGMELQLDIDTGWKFLQRIYPFAGLEYHWAKYYAQADWNLRTDFEHPKSFEHEASGSGLRVQAGFGTRFSGKWSLEFRYTQEKWSAENGIDRIFLNDGTRLETSFNAVNWESSSAGLFVRYQF